MAADHEQYGLTGPACRLSQEKMTLNPDVLPT
jgi:hypothetical protein